MFPIHLKFPDEMAAVGRILVNYGELELDLMHAVSMAKSVGLNTALKSIFRVRGETNRIDIADGIARASYVAGGLEAEFDEAIAVTRACLAIRNRYAHAYWHSPEKTILCYVSLEELAKDKDEIKDLMSLTFFVIDLPLLKQQEDFFLYASRLLTYMNYELRARTMKTFVNPFGRPPVVAKPQPFTRKIENDDPSPAGRAKEKS